MTFMKHHLMNRISFKPGRYFLPMLLAGMLFSLDGAAQSLTIQVRPNATPVVGTVSPTNSFAVTNVPQTVSVTADESNPAYAFDHWEMVTNAALSVFSIDTDPSVFINVTSTNSPALVRAVYRSRGVSLIITADPPGGGYTSPGLGTNWYSSNVNVSVTATASNNYEFLGWQNAAVGNANPVGITMNESKSLVAKFINLWTVTQYKYSSPFDVVPYAGVVARDNSNLTVSVSSYFYNYLNYRFRCNGYSNVVGAALADNLGGGITQCNIWPIKTNVNITWAWTRQWEVKVLGDTNGTAVITDLGPGDGLTSDEWYDDGTTVTISMKARDTSLFQPDYCLVNAAKLYPDLNGDITPVTIASNTVIRPYFKTASASVLPNWYITLWNLIPGAAGNGPNDDPDRDGLNNMQEASYSNTNSGWYFNPLNADSDGDGMDDGYEYNAIDPTNMPPAEAAIYRRAATDSGANSEDNGREGNPDKDYYWDTLTGYEDKGRPLSNWEEYNGPDGLGPFVTNVSFGQTVCGIPYPLTNNPATARPTVYILVTDPFYTGDTGDQSRGNQVFTDKDVFDDGYEFTWDLWQQAHGGEVESFIIGVTNGVAVSIDNIVPDWATARVFNPRVKYSQAGGAPDNDVLYDYVSGKVSLSWYDSAAEYNAWVVDAFTPNVAAAPHSIRMDNPPPGDLEPKRSSHPFLVDVDQDGLPDGYEVIFGYDPWNALTAGSQKSDGLSNPDGDWMAMDGTNGLALVNHEIYQRDGFDPRVAVDQTYPVASQMPGPGTDRSPTTEYYSNIAELRGPDGIMSMINVPLADDATNPNNFDSDGDGIWDGWEMYVGMDPNGKNDAGLDTDKDKLSSLAEFQSFYTSSTNRQALLPLVAWQNKIFPTDPNFPDTDGDLITDADEMPLFNGTSIATSNLVFNEEGDLVIQGFASGVWNGSCYTGGGLNPTSADTDADTLPDPWEGSYPAAVDGTLGDAFLDPDGDRMLNYQEYFAAAVYHWQYDAWVNGQASYDNGDFFQGTPHNWDWVGEDKVYIPLFGGGGKLSIYAYAGSNPGAVDTDWDGMDDYYEVFHGLNPVYGNIDLVASRSENRPLAAGVTVADVRDMPFVNGSPMMDSDGDGLPNAMEYANFTTPTTSPTYHTDPTPLWITDTGYDPYLMGFGFGYERSWVNLYYQPGSVWPWSGKNPSPVYAFDFESNEGYDTDNDGFSDKEELNTTQTDPLSPEHPIKRRALYFPPGQKAYARSFPSDVPSRNVSRSRGRSTAFFTEDTFRSFTVEAWVRPLTPASGQEQVVVERSLIVPVGNPMFLVPGVRLNFRLAIDADGLPYVAYTGDGDQVVFRDAKAPASTKLAATNWVHLCGTYKVPSATDPTVRGVLSLYVNGQLVSQTNPNELPAIGHFAEGSQTIVTYPGSIVVGASDRQPDASISGLGTGASYTPAPTNFFKGWIDEIRIWDGARSAAEVQAGMRTRMKQSDVLANGTPYVRPQLLCLYDSDNLADPDHSATAPAGLGFDLTATAIFPADWPYVSFWGVAPERSMVYSDYRYLPWIENAAAHTPSVPAMDMGNPNAVTPIMDGTNVVGYTLPFANSWDPYGWKHYTFPQYAPASEGQYGFIRVNDLLPLGWTAADEDVPMWDNGTVPATTPYDSDGDGLPDQWEESFGLDPLNATGDNGASADPDQDGLSNIAEFLAGTSPRNSDTYGWGFGDYNSWKPGTVYRTYGELLTDHDGMPDAWEMENGLNTRLYDAYGVYGDPDGDGWANYTEYMKMTDPMDPSKRPDPTVNGSIKYNGTRTNGSVIVMGYQRPAMDGVPIYGTSGGGVIRSASETIGSGDGQTTVFSGRLKQGSIVQGSVKVRRLNPRFVTPDFDFTDDVSGNWTYYPDFFSSQATTNVTFDYGSGEYTFVWPDQDGFGMVSPWSGDQIFIDYQWKDGDPNSFNINGLRDGDLYLFAYRDNNGNNQWDAGEPAGVAERQPIRLGWDDLTGVIIALTDNPPPGHARFGWPQVDGQDFYVIRVVNRSVTGTPLVFAATNMAPLNWFHEGQLNNLGIVNLPEASYQWYARKADGVTEITNGLFYVTHPSNAKPTVLSPMGSTLSYTPIEIVWTMDRNADRFRVQVARDSGFTAIVHDGTADVPFRSGDGSYRYTLPVYPGDRTFTNALYYWRVQGINNKLTSSWSDSSQFTLALLDPPAGVSTISGDVKYYGKAGGTQTITIILQAFDNAGFGGDPLAQVTITNKPDTNMVAILSGSNAPAPSVLVTPFNKGSYKFMGLKSGVYYVRAFMDMNGNGRADNWETQGFIANTARRPRGNLVGTQSITMDQDIVIEDRDLDSDSLPDAWEWVNFSTLTWTGNDDPAGTGASLLAHYGDTYFDSDPTQKLDPLSAYEITHNLAPKADSDRDGISDAVEVLVTHTDPFSSADRFQAKHIIASRPGVNMSLTWEGRAGVNYQVQISSNLITWEDAPLGAFSGTGTLVFVDEGTSNAKIRFYRILAR